MSKFMESIATDVDDVFFDLDFFGSMCNIDGRDIVVVMDDEELHSLQKTDKDGIYKNDMLLFIRAKDIGKKLKVGSYLDVDGKRLFVHDVTETAGVYKVVLGRNQI